MYPITRESVMAVISSSVAENAVCWCDGRKKRSRRIFGRLTHLATDGRVIGGLESAMAIAYHVVLSVPVVQSQKLEPRGTLDFTGETSYQMRQALTGIMG